jgi:hypothetical protein
VLTPDDIKKLKELEQEGDNGQSSSNITKRGAHRHREMLWVTKIIPYELPESLKGICSNMSIHIKCIHIKWQSKTSIWSSRLTYKTLQVW